MSIGLFDMDFATYMPLMFNLEIMKLSTYFKRQREVVLLMPELDTDRFSKVFIRKDYDDGNFDNRFFLPHVTYGGRAFNKLKYIPLPQEQEVCRPDESIYSRFATKYSYQQNNDILFKMMSRAEHVRLTQDGINIWEPGFKYFGYNTGKVLIVHDYDLGSVKDGDLVVKDLMAVLRKRNPIMTDSYLGLKFPINVYNDKDFKKWEEIKGARSFYTIQYNGDFNTDQILEYAYGVARQNISYNLNYNVTYGSSDENDFIENHLLKIFRQVLFLQSIHQKITLIYDDDFFIDKRWEEIIKLFNLYLNFSSNTKNKSLCTLFSYLTFPFWQKLYDYDVERIKELFQLVRVKNYETFKLFYKFPNDFIQEMKLDDR